MGLFQFCSKNGVRPVKLDPNRPGAGAEHGRDPQRLEISTGCPDALPGSGADPLAAVEERRGRGVDRVVLPLPPFLPDIENSLGEFGERVIRQSI